MVVRAARPGLRAGARTSHDDEAVSRVKRHSEVEGATHGGSESVGDQRDVDEEF